MSGQNRSQNGCLGAATKLLTFLILLAAIAAAIGIGIYVFMPGVIEQNTPVDEILPTMVGIVPEKEAPTRAATAVVPTLPPTPTLIPLAATWTPAPTAQNSSAETIIVTLGPTNEPTATGIIPTKTPTPTNTPTPTTTPTATPIGPSPTPLPTKSPFPFTRSDTSPFYLQNFANSAGCDWMGVAGEVLNLTRNPVGQGSYQVHIWGSGVEERILIGSAPDYSPSGYEQFLFNLPVIRDYNIQLETISGSAVSPVYNFQTRASCNENLVRFDFVQNH